MLMRYTLLKPCHIITDCAIYDAHLHACMHTHNIEQALYLLVAAMALVTSYMVSAALILRQTEGLWRLPLGGGAWEALQRAAIGNGRIFNSLN
jgi:hypothetical protein